MIEQLHGAGHFTSRTDGIDDRLILGGIGIDGAAHHLHPIADVIRSAMDRPLEYGMLNKVGKPRQLLRVVSAPGVDPKATPHHSAPGGQESAP